ncbi:MAG: Gfo/Idh/MocA family oxidoreductase [Gemmatimonadetes bacterium]|jgi:predicted dehydrogenase|nr:Gfo/Idh/MocA family oxidoreductase [Gemmatimonadota bacterium]MBT5143231.1 Gfo/Idh/MocA family oxidoreductase [Gemmatimonadota bacterium]MBT5586835.1 Gfo/Idh/MocA family oxidoreductase [Gemmatimonadota bacterium]MBT5960958.1 Gfo/Idh/MocA family oxidoreductase [Gemmatimonadota bacterium]MBT6627776.1 Gfo/Idh/MocA family oxidoreductase [Gemmatimonadota bacterium]
MSLRIGIVGAGANTRSRHIPGFQEIDGVEVVAVCNRSRESGQKAADEFGIATVYENWQELVAADDIDAVCVGTWPYLHCDISIATLEAGKHILTEARMAMDLAEARRMQAAAKGSDRVAMIVPAPFYLESEPTLLQMVADGAFGSLLEIHVSALGGGFDTSTPLHWRQRRDLSGQNIMAMGILNETVRRYAGHDRALVAHAHTFTTHRPDPEGGKRAVDVPDSLGIVTELESGATAVYHISSVAKHGRGGCFEVHGTKGAFKLEGGKAFVALEGDDDFRILDVAPEKAWGWDVEADFVASIRDSKPVTHTNFDDGVKYMTFTEAVQVSLSEGRKVELGTL